MFKKLCTEGRRTDAEELVYLPGESTTQVSLETYKVKNIRHTFEPKANAMTSNLFSKSGL